MKLKVKSSVSKRFKITATGKVIGSAINKKHGLTRKPTKRKKLNKGTFILCKVEANFVKKHLVAGKL